jgi:hypothetical protein
MRRRSPNLAVKDRNAQAVCSGTPIVSRSRLSDRGRGDHAVEAAGYRIAHVDGEAENRRSRVRIL